MKKIKPFFIITRPINVLIGCLSIFIGAFIAGSLEPLAKVILASISGGIIAAAANAINDYFDINIDKINKPHRPLPSGLITRNAVFNFSIILFLIGIGLSIFINIKAIYISVFASIILYLYSARLKRSVLWGNISVSLISAFAFIYGGVAVDLLNNALIPASFAFLFHFGREIIKDIEDQKGDMVENAQTLPIKFGTKIALTITTIIFITLIVVTFIPYILHIFGLYYLITVAIGVDLFLLFVIYSMWRDPSSANLHRLSSYLKIDMIVGLIAIYLGRF